MKSFKQHIIELFDKPYKWRKMGKIDVSKVDPAPKMVSYYFKTDDGREITVDVGHLKLKGKHKAVIEFTDETNDFSFDLTGKGDSFRVMSTILDAVKDTIETTNPELINFSADKKEGWRGTGAQDKRKETGRAKLYKTMVKRFASKLGYTSKDKDDGKSIVFNLIRKK